MLPLTTYELCILQADDSTEGEGSESDDNRGGGESLADDGENDSAPDLDASMEDMDDDVGDVTGETDDVDNTEDYEEEPSDSM